MNCGHAITVNIRAAAAAALALVALIAASPAAAAVNSSVTGSNLTVTTDGATVNVTCGLDGLVKVNGADPGGGGTLACTTVTGIGVDAGAAASIDLSGVTAAAFPNAVCSIDGSSGNDTVVGSAGDDQITGGGGADSLSGGPGNDTYPSPYFSPVGSMTINDTSGDNVLDFAGSPVGVTVDLSQSAGQLQTIDSLGDTLSLTGRFTGLNGSTFDDVLTGSALNDSIWGDAGNDTISAGAGDNSLAGGTGDDTITAGSGNDTYSFQAVIDGNDTIADSGGSNDELYVNGFDDGSNGNTMTFSGTTLTAQGASLSFGGLDLILVNGTAQDDVIDASAAAPGTTYWLNGDQGNDTIIGSGGDDVIQSGAGNDTLSGGPGNDSISSSAGTDAIDGGTGDDYFWLADGAKTVTDASGVDNLDLRSLTTPVVLDLALSAGQLQGFGSGNSLALTGTFEEAIGTAFDDHLYGNAADNLLAGWSGHDVLDGRGGSDAYELYNSSIFGGPSPTVVQVTDTGTSGTDVVRWYGSGSDDTFSIAASSLNDGSDSATLSGIDGSVSVYGYLDDDPNGGTGNDTFTVVSAPAGGLLLDGEDGSDSYTIHFGALAGSVGVVDSGASGTDALTVDCSGTTLAAGSATNGGQTVTYSGIEAPPSCSPAAPAPAPTSSGGGGGSGGGGVRPDLHVDLQSSAATAPASGSELDFFVTVSMKNLGASSAVSLEIALPTGYIVSRTYADRGQGCTAVGPTTLRCDVAWVNAGASTHVQIFGVTGSSGEQDVTATASSLVERELDPTDNTSTAKVMPAVSVPSSTAGDGSAVKVVLAAPTIAGTAKQGGTLHATRVAWNGTPSRVSYQWQACTKTGCSPIKGATSTTLHVTPALAGRSVRLVARAIVNGRQVTIITARKQIARR